MLKVVRSNISVRMELSIVRYTYTIYSDTLHSLPMGHNYLTSKSHKDVKRSLLFLVIRNDIRGASTNETF